VALTFGGGPVTLSIVPGSTATLNTALGTTKAADVKTALSAINSDIKVNNVPVSLNNNITVTGPDGGPFVITFTNALKQLNVGQIQANDSGGTHAIVSIATTVDGTATPLTVSGPTNGIYTITLTGPLAATGIPKLATQLGAGQLASGALGPIVEGR